MFLFFIAYGRCTFYSLARMHVDRQRFSYLYRIFVGYVCLFMYLVGEHDLDHAFLCIFACYPSSERCL